MKLHEIFARKALELGADAVAVIPAVELPVEPDLRDYCRSCPSYGTGGSCPPYVMDSPEFVRRLRRYEYAIIFRLDVPLDILRTDAHLAYSERIYRIASALSREALLQGAGLVQALGSGSCRKIFCAAESDCPVVDQSGPCRRPGLSAPSISGMGIHVFRLAEGLGWPIRKITASESIDEADSDKTAEESLSPDQNPDTGMLVGMVLVDGRASELQIGR